MITSEREETGGDLACFQSLRNGMTREAEERDAWDRETGRVGQRDGTRVSRAK